jgi:hypothetical protein
MYTCIIMDTQQVSKRRSIQTLLTDEEMREVKHHVIDRKTNITKWTTEAVKEKLSKEKRTDNAINT